MAEAQEVAHFGNWEWVHRRGPDHLVGRALPDLRRSSPERVRRQLRGLPGAGPSRGPRAGRRARSETRSRAREPLPVRAPDRAPRRDGPHPPLPRRSRSPTTTGKVVRLVGVCQDITELADAERSRRIARERAFATPSSTRRSASRWSSIGDDEPTADRVQPGDARDHRLRATTELRGRQRSTLIAAEEDRYLDRAQRRRLLAGELDSYTVEKRFRHKAGHQIWCQLSVSLARESERRGALRDPPDAGHQRAPALRAAASLPRRPRQPHRPAQPAPLPRRARAADRLQRSATAARARS